MIALDRLFDKSAQDQIAAAVGGAESRTLGQIVPVVVERSDRYAEARGRGAVVGVVAVTSCFLLFLPHLQLWQLALTQVATGCLGWALGSWPPAWRRLAGARALNSAARERAVLAFQEHGLHRTPEGTGVLIFASLFERAVVILGDRGIDARMGPQGWQATVDGLVRAIQEDRPGPGFVEAIERCGKVLEQHFPRTGGPVSNSLEDHLRLDSSR